MSGERARRTACSSFRRTCPRPASRRGEPCAPGLVCHVCRWEVPLCTPFPLTPPCHDSELPGRHPDLNPSLVVPILGTQLSPATLNRLTHQPWSQVWAFREAPTMTLSVAEVSPHLTAAWEDRAHLDKYIRQCFGEGPVTSPSSPGAW